MKDKIREHPLIASSIAAGVVLILGAILVQVRSSTPAYTGEQAWYGNSANNTKDQISAIPNTVPTANTATPSQYTTQILPFTTSTAAQQSPNQTNITALTTDDLDTLLQSISLSRQTKPISSSTTSTTHTWTYIPSTLVSTTTEETLSPLRQELHQYGNEIGSMIQGFEAAHHTMVQVLTDGVNDRQDITKEQAVERIGQDMIMLGKNISAIGHVPKTAQGVHAALAQSYQTAGAALVKSAQAQSQRDTDYLTSLKLYNTTAEAYTRAFTNMALLFSFNEVSFSSNDPGGVFSFSGGGL